MAPRSKMRITTVYKTLGLPGKEFMLPNIFCPWLIQEFEFHPYVSGQIEQQSFPTTLLGDSFLSEPSIPLVESVEAFALGHIETPFGHSSVIIHEEVLVNEHESHGCEPLAEDAAECHQILSSSSHNETFQDDGNALLTTSSNPDDALVNCHSIVKGIAQMKI